MFEIRKCILGVVISALQVNCNYTRDKVTQTEEDIPPVSQLSIEYSTVEKYVTGKYCNECHRPGGQASGLLLNSYDGLTAFVTPGDPNSSIVYLSLQQNGGRMPKDAQAIPDRAVQILKAWIELGAPDKAVVQPNPEPVTPEDPNQPPPVEPEPIEPAPVEPPLPNFAQIKEQIIDVHCISCHKNVSPRLNTYEDMFQLRKGKQLTVAGSPDDSLFYTVLLGERPRMPIRRVNDAGPVTQEKLDLLADWIQKGAPEN